MKAGTAIGDIIKTAKARLQIFFKRITFPHLLSIFLCYGFSAIDFYTAGQIYTNPHGLSVVETQPVSRSNDKCYISIFEFKQKKTPLY
jgi:hypothetical protein